MVMTEMCADLATCPLGDRTVQLRARALWRCGSASLHWVDGGGRGHCPQRPLPITSGGFGQALWSLWPCFFTCSVQFNSEAQSCPTLSSHGLQHTRPPCPSPTSGVYPVSPSPVKGGDNIPTHLKKLLGSQADLSGTVFVSQVLPEHKAASPLEGGPQRTRILSAWPTHC